MYEISGRASAVLADIQRHFDESDSEYPFMQDGPGKRLFAQILKNGFIEVAGAWGTPILKILDITASGTEHVMKYRQSMFAAGYPVLSPTQDSLLRELNTNGRVLNLEENIDDIRFLSRNHLIEVQFADNTVYAVKGLTEHGIIYCEDRIPEREITMTTINNAPIFNNTVANSATSEINNTVSISFTAVLSSILSSSLDQNQKAEAEKALTEMENAAEKKDQKGFLASVEKIASIAKNAADAADVVIPLIAKIAASISGAC